MSKWYLLAPYVRALAERTEEFGRPPEDHDALRRFAEISYSRCVEWFGHPQDPKCPYAIRSNDTSYHTYCCFHPYYQLYNIYISDECKGEGNRYSSIGHEMYHRFTMRREGFFEELWMSELLAQETAYQLLKENGFEELAELRRTRICNQLDGRVDYRMVSTTKRPLGVPGAPPYPHEFVVAVNCIAAAFSTVLKWEIMRTATRFENMGDWLASLKPAERYCMRRLLNRPFHEDMPELAVEERARLGAALCLIGELEQAEEELRRCLQVAPHNAELRRQLGIVLMRAYKWTEAIYLYDENEQLGIGNSQMHLNFGRAYMEQGHYSEALIWLRRACMDPNRQLSGRWQIAKVFIRMDKRAWAREIWEEMLVLDREGKFKASVEKELYKYPLPEMVRVKPRRKQLQVVEV